MARGENQKLKLTYLQKILLEKTDESHGLTMPQLLKELENYGIVAERKSVYADIEAINENLDIEVIKEQNGRSTVYYATNREFELAEIKLLIDSIQSSKFITEKKSKELIKKIKSLVSVYEANQLERQVFVNGRIKTMNESIYYSVDAIHYAIAGNFKIRFQYCVWNLNKELEPKKEGAYYIVSPWALAWDDENYYLVGYDSKAEKIKHYRVDKMMHISVTNEKREGDEHFKNFDPAEYAKRNFGMFGGELRKVHIEFPNQMCGVFIDRFGKDIKFIAVDENKSEVIVNVEVSNQFFGWILGLGPEVKITGPDDVVEKMRDAAEAFLKNYK